MFKINKIKIYWINKIILNQYKYYNILRNKHIFIFNQNVRFWAIEIKWNIFSALKFQVMNISINFPFCLTEDFESSRFHRWSSSKSIFYCTWCLYTLIILSTISSQLPVMFTFGSIRKLPFTDVNSLLVSNFTVYGTHTTVDMLNVPTSFHLSNVSLTKCLFIVVFQNRLSQRASRTSPSAHLSYNIRCQPVPALRRYREKTKNSIDRKPWNSVGNVSWNLWYISCYWWNWNIESSCNAFTEKITASRGICAWVSNLDLRFFQHSWQWKLQPKLHCY